MNSARQDLISHYWGKADENYIGAHSWHSLGNHSLDVVAVAASWWDVCAPLRGNMLVAFAELTSKQERQLRAWVLFFVALHDLGKFDIRFQLKSPAATAAAWKPMQQKDHELAAGAIKTFDHGHAGIAWAYREYRTWLSRDDADCAIWERWQPWLSSVTGHHGDFHDPSMQGLALDTDEVIIAHDQLARHAFVDALSHLILEPAELSLNDLPPPCSLTARSLLGGYCAVCDWVGSNVAEFDYRAPRADMDEYLRERVVQIQSSALLKRFGLLAVASPYAGVSALLGIGEAPRGVQTEIDRLPVKPGLTLIEAPTGSGKTEAALAYAWRLLDAGVADSVVFALPTQATANAMLLRAEAFANSVFGDANIVLAHGKRQFNEGFQRLAANGGRVPAQGRVEASVQCAAWLASSRKRVFLGQIGVCTVDQVLLSVLPVRHKFVRAFGVNKSVLIVDEVHAYDAYMHGLLGEVLRQQKANGGSAVLLSATLPANVRAKLLKAWDASGADVAPYPALWHAVDGGVEIRSVSEAQRPPRRAVGTECLKLPGAFPDAAVIARIIAAAEAGARVAVVMNLVDDAQRLARLLRDQTELDVDLFHARYRFIDRQKKETSTLAHYGRAASRQTGRILVATQVVEQSLDLDFDWLLTQICPVDLLFQRMGRLHRHARPNRPTGFELARCTVLSVDGDDYGLHKLIYGNTRVLWRTEQLLYSTKGITFPEAYRDWIERVYQRDDWNDEPESIALGYDVFHIEQRRREKEALRLTTLTVKNFHDDDDSGITGLTRDDEMSLTVLPIQRDGHLLDGQSLSLIPEREFAEALNLNAAPAPASWKKRFSDFRIETDGPLARLAQLEMVATGTGNWCAVNGKYRYSEDFGLEKNRDESA